MRRFCKSIKHLSLFGIAFWLSGITASANDAVSDILNNNRYQGAINQISGITSWFDDKMVMIISFCSFALISFSILQNVVAGTCLAYPKFWNKVHQAHQQKSFGAALMGLAGGIKGMIPGPQGGGGGMNTTGGGSSMILSFIPDLMALTDLEDNEVTAKIYFSKALPKMFLCICIGIFIYNGYYRDSASLVGGMGSEIVERALGSVSPESFVNKITNTTAKPSSIYEASTDRKGQNAHAITDAIYTSIVGNVNGGAVSLTSAEKTSIMRQAEVCAANILDAHGDWFDYSKDLEYSLSVTSRFINSGAVDNYSQYSVQSKDSWAGTTTGDFSGTVFIPATEFNAVDDFAANTADFGGVVLAISATAKDWSGTTEAEFVKPSGDAAAAQNLSFDYYLKMSTVASKAGGTYNATNDEIVASTPDKVATAVQEIVFSGSEYSTATVTMKSGPSGASGTAVGAQDITYTVKQKFNKNGSQVDVTYTVVVHLQANAADDWDGKNPIQGVQEALAQEE